MESPRHILQDSTDSPPETGSGMHIRLQQFVIAGLLLVVFLLCYSQITDDDVFWHLATGRWIAEHASVPSQDIFGHLTQGEHWIPFEWGWDLLTYGLYSLPGNYLLLQFLPAAIWLLIVSVQISAFRRLRIPLPIVVALILLELFASLYSLSLRPYCISLLGLTIVGNIIFTFKYTASPLSTGKRFVWLPVIFLIWTNMHPGVLAGVLLLFLILASEIFLYYVVQQSTAPETGVVVHGMEADAIIRLEMIFAICVAAVIVNPHGLATFDYVYEHTKLKTLETIREWMPPFSASLGNPLGGYYIALIVAGFSAVVYSIRRRYPLPAVLFAGFLLLSLKAVRFVADFSLVSMYGTALGLHDLVPSRPAFIRRFLGGRAALVCLLLIEAGLAVSIFNGSFYTAIGYHRHFGAGIDRHYFPEHAMQFLKTNHIDGKPFNQFELGGYLIWELYGQQNFIDSRNLNDHLISEYFSMAGESPEIGEKLERFGIDYIILHFPGMIQSPLCMQSSVVPWCAGHPECWKLVYWDDRALIYLKDVPKYRSVIADNEYRILDPYLFAFRHHFYDSLRLAEPVVYRNELQRKLGEDPGSYLARAFAQIGNGQ
jgi:hypothetical protein